MSINFIRDVTLFVSWCGRRSLRWSRTFISPDALSCLLPFRSNREGFSVLWKVMCCGMR